MPYPGLVQLIGKYVFLAGMYVFLFWIFRELFRTLRFEQSAGRGVVPRAQSAGRGVAPPAQSTGRGAVPSGRTAAPGAAPPRAAAGVPATSRSGRDEPEPVHVQPGAESRPARAKPALIVRDPGGSGLSAGTVFPITAAVTIGRAKDNSIRISDRFASGHHAIIFLKNGRRILRDRGSTNGTARNGKRVADEVALSNGDLIGVGTVVLEYRSDGTR